MRAGGPTTRRIDSAKGSLSLLLLRRTLVAGNTKDLERQGADSRQRIALASKISRCPVGIL